MSAWFKKSSRPSVEELPEVLQDLLTEVREERGQLEALLARVTTASKTMAGHAKDMEALDEAQKHITERVGSLAERLGAVEALGDTLASVDRGSKELASSQEALEGKLAGMSADVEHLEHFVKEVRDAQVQANDVRLELDSLGGESGPVRTLAKETGELHARLEELAAKVAETDERQGGVGRSQEDMLAKVNEVHARADELADEVEESSAKLSRFQSTLSKLSQIQETAARAEQQLQALSILGEHVNQKLVSFEKQREVVDRAVAQAARLDDLVWDIDARLKKVQEDGKRIAETQMTLADVQELSAETAAHLEDMKDQKAKTMKEAEALEVRLLSVRSEIRTELGRLDTERGGLEALNRQMAELRSGLVDMERRQAALEDSNRAVAEAKTRADDLGAKLITLAADVGRVEEHAERVRTVRANLAMAQEDSRALLGRLRELEESKPSVDELSEKLVSLSALGDTVADSRDRLTAAREELERSHETHTDVRGWLTETRSQLAELQGRMRDLTAMSARVDDTRQLADRALSQVARLGEREGFVHQLEARVDDLRALRQELDERAEVLSTRKTEIQELERRTAGLSEGLRDADRQFETVAKRAEEVAEVEKLLADVTDRVSGMEGRVGGLVGELEDAERRAVEMEALSAKMDAVNREVREREQAIDTALADLDRASGLRADLESAIREMEAQSRAVSGAIEDAGEQASAMTDLAQRMESRVGNLRFTEKRMTQFEDRLSSLQQSEKNLEEAVQGLAERQKSVDAVRAELTSLFESMDRTVEEVRTIGEARGKVDATRATLDKVLARAEEVDQLAEAVERRRAEVEDAERRMVRIEALLTDLRTGMQTLRGEKALVDMAIEKTGDLTYQLKEADAFLRALKDERRTVVRVLEAVKPDDEEEPGVTSIATH